MIGRSRGRSGGAILTMIVLGVAAGVFFFLRDQNQSSGSVESSPMVETIFTPTPLATLPQPLFPERPTSTPNLNATLVIPRSNVVANIVPVYLGEGGSWNIRFLGGNVGHLYGTAWVGEVGNIVLAGHVEMSDGSPGIFAQVENLSANDEILLQVGNELRIYAVTEIIRTTPTDLTVLYPTPDDQLTLITCDGYDFVSNTYSERVVAKAVRRS